jgi:hypothetical protein
MDLFKQNFAENKMSCSNKQHVSIEQKLIFCHHVQMKNETMKQQHAPFEQNMFSLNEMKQSMREKK